MTRDAIFIFNEVTGNYQEISVQGQVTYRIADPVNTAGLLDFSINPKTGRHASEDPDILEQRIINTVQSYARTAINNRDMEQALKDVKSIETEVFELITQDDKLNEYGIVINKPTTKPK